MDPGGGVRLPGVRLYKNHLDKERTQEFGRNFATQAYGQGAQNQISDICEEGQNPGQQWQECIVVQF